MDSCGVTLLVWKWLDEANLLDRDFESVEPVTCREELLALRLQLLDEEQSIATLHG